MSNAESQTKLKIWPYTYDNLEAEQSIRCFELWPGKFEDNLMVSLSTTTLDTAPAYEAVSYVWGDPKENQRVLLMEPDNWTGFGYVNVPKSLSMALRRLRRGDSEICLWADALCIDQSNLSERSQQVRRMADIFCKAKQVIVWMGPDVTGQGAHAFELAGQLAKLNDPSDRSTRGAKNEEPGLEVLDILGDDGLQTMTWLAQHTWFRRVWTMQELGCSRAAIMMIGHASITWNKLYSAYDLAMHFELAGEMPQDFGVMTLLFHWQTADWVGFLRIVLSLAYHGTSDPRDRIYALLGHPSAFTPTFTGSSAPILQPDYCKTVDEVYSEAAKAMLLQEGNLDVLSCVRHQASNANSGRQLASWAPDWDAKLTTAQIWDDMQSSCGSQGGPLYHILPTITDNGNVYELHSSGIHCGTVVWHYPAQHSDQVEATESFRALPQAPEERPTFYLNQAVRSMPRVSVVSPKGQPINPLSNDFKRRRLTAIEATTQRELSIGRSVFWTDTGLFGLGPDILQKGDVLYVLHAGRVPYLLRSAGAVCHTLVGETLVNGLMDGEMVEHAEEAHGLVLV